MKNLKYLFLLIFLIVGCEEDITLIQYTLTTQVTPTGSGTVSPSSGNFDEGVSVTISATATENYNFLRWTGTANSTANPYTFTMNSNANITAEFELVDSDGDGVLDDKDLCSETLDGETVDENGCSDSQKDTDGDGLTNDKDTCNDTPEGEDIDENGCSISDKISLGRLIWYPFNNNAKNKVSSKYDGLVEGPTLVPDRFGNNHSAYSFKGNNDRIYTSTDTEFNNLKKISISLWYNMNSHKNYNHFINQEGKYALAENLNADTKIYFYYDDSNFIKTGQKSPLNVWNHLVITYEFKTGFINESICKIYLNNTIVGSFTTTKDLENTTKNLIIGNYGETPSAINGFDGIIDDIMIWDRVLSPDEVLYLYLN